MGRKEDGMATAKSSKALNILIPIALYDKLKEDAEKKNISLASVVKIACSQYLENQQK